MVPIITLDGPSGSGKGTLAVIIAQHYGYALLDSGAIYRIVGLAAHQAGLLQYINENDLAQLAHQIDMQFMPTEKGINVLLNSVDVTDQIRTEQVGAYASQIASLPAVRAALMQKQKNFAQLPGLVADGRDMGTVVFPDAPAKIYLTASSEARAQRRAKQLQNMGIDVNLASILQDIQARDDRDMNRSVAPLRPAVDALIVDCSEMTIDEVKTQLINYINLRLGL